MNNITLAPVQTDQPSHLMPVFGRQPISFDRGQGSYLYTEDGHQHRRHRWHQDREDSRRVAQVCGGHAGHQPIGLH